MSLIEETDDSTHERTGQGELEAAFPPPLTFPSQIKGNSDFFGSNRNFGKTNIYKSFRVSFRLFFL